MVLSNITRLQSQNKKNTETGELLPVCSAMLSVVSPQPVNRCRSRAMVTP